jgi:hypothetical protein
MVIGSAERRLNIQLWFLAMLIDVVIAALIAYFLLERESWLFNTFWVWLGLQILSFVLVILGAIRLLALHWAGGFRPAKNGLLTLLEANDFPAPEPYVGSVDDYLEGVGNNEHETIKTRMTAATLLGARQGVKSMAGFVKGMMIDSAHEDALKEYASRSPRPRATAGEEAL